MLLVETPTGRDAPGASARWRMRWSHRVHNNNFDSLRLIGALLVLTGHAFVLTAHFPVPRLFGIPIHTLGVAVFFCVSGYLVQGSWLRRRNLSGFLRNRCLRIFPGLVAVVLATVFIVGPVVTSVGPEYFHRPQTYHYLLSITLDAQYLLPGVFEGAVHSSQAVNGSLWSLGVEFICYLVVLGAGLALRERGYVIFATLAVLCAAATFAPAQSPLDSLKPAASMVVFFAAGAILSAVKPGMRTLASMTLAGLVVWLGIAVAVPSVAILGAWVTLPGLVILLGRTTTPGLRSAARFGDLSYGIYLWAFPVQQLVVHCFGHVALALNLLLVFAFTLPMAFISWHLIERRALVFALTSSRTHSVPASIHADAEEQPRALPAAVDRRA